MEERYTFGTYHLHMLHELREKLERFGYTCTVEHTPHEHGEVTFFTHTLVAVRPAAGKLYGRK
jgi:hypothetical protein